LKSLLPAAILILIAGFVAALALLPIDGGRAMARNEMTQTLSHMKQLHLATQQMALDARTTGDTNLPLWTCSGTTPLTLEQWTNALVKNGYLTETDLKKLLSQKEHRAFWSPRVITNVMTVFAVTDDDPSNTLFLATGNWQGLTNTALVSGAYPKTGFVVFQKGGDGAVLRTNQTTAINLIGSGGLHNYRPLR
jgi:hypothetical protein